jgi:SNF2 family DNA or RNA helicase
VSPPPRKSLEPFLKDEVQFFDHQVKGVRKLAPMESFLLADDMGLGKSLQTLTVFCIDVKRGQAETLMVVCPVTLRDNWAAEIEKFTRIPYTLFGEEPVPGRRDKTRTLPPVKRVQQLYDWMFHQNGPRILIANYEQLITKQTQALFKNFKFDAIAADEAHYLKNPEAQRTKAFQLTQSTRSFLLTGTPLLNHVNELWVLFNRIDPVRYPRYYAFVNRYCVFGGYENRQIVGTKNEKELISELGRIMLRRMKDTTLNRDKPTYTEVYTGMSDTQRKLYDSVIEELILPDPAGDQQIDNPLTKFLRARQICGTPAALGPDYPDDSMKLDRAIEITAELLGKGERFGVFSEFRGVMSCFRDRARKLGVPVFEIHGDVARQDRLSTVQQWGLTKEPGVIVCQSKVAGEGLNMVAGSICMRLDRFFVPGKNRQVVDRFDRIGQTKPVQVIDLKVRGSIEQRVDEILKDKGHTFGTIVEGGVGMGKLLDALREQLRRDMQ